MTNSTAVEGAPGTEADEAVATEEPSPTKAAIIADRWYTVEAIAATLGVPVAKVQAAIEAGRFLNTAYDRMSRYNVQNDVQELLGQSVVAWVEADSIETNIRAHQATDEVPRSADPGGAILAEAFAENEAVTRQEQNGVAEATEQAEQSYLQILVRLQTGAGQDSDQANLVLAMQDLGLSQAQVEADHELVGNALKWHAAFADREPSNQRAGAARSEYEGVLKRHKVEDQLAFQKKTAAEGYASECYEARHRLYELARQRPALFEDSDPPRLRSPDVPAESGAGTG